VPIFAKKIEMEGSSNHPLQEENPDIPAQPVPSIIGANPSERLTTTEDEAEVERHSS
jgi:hypothetical protein